MATSKLELAVGTGQWDAGLKKAQQALNSFTQSQGGLQQAIGKDNEKITQFVQMMGKMESTANTAKGQLRDYRNSIEQLSAAFNSLSEAQKKGAEGQAITLALDSLKAKAMAAKQEVERLNVELGGVGKTGGGFKDLLSGVSSKFGMSPTMFTGIGAAIAGIGTAAKIAGDNIRPAFNFEKSMSYLSALTGKTGKDLETLKEYAIELGSTTTLTASQVADAFRLIGSQQPQLLESSEALRDVTKAAIRLSEASGMELATASQTLSTSINQMGGDSKNAAKYVNVLAAAAQKGAGDIAWLGEAITKSGTYAKAVGASYESLVANLETLAKAGYDASTAGTALRSIILALEKQADDNLKPSVVGLTEAFENLGKQNLTISEYASLVNQRFAAQAMTLAENAAQSKAMTEAITGTNIAEEQADTNTSNLSGSLKALASAWEGLNLHINNSNGLLKDFVDWAKKAVQWGDRAFTSAGRQNGFRNDIQNNKSTRMFGKDITGVVPNLQRLGGSNYKGQVYHEIQQMYNDAILAGISYRDNKTQPGSKSREEAQASLDAIKNAQKEFTERARKMLGLVKEEAGNKGKIDLQLEVDAETEVATKSIKQLQEELKKLKKLRDEAAGKGDTELRDKYNLQIKTVQDRIKELRGGTTTNNKTPTAKDLGPMQEAQKKISDLTTEALTADDERLEVIKKEIAALNEQLKVYKEIQDYVNGKTPNFNVTVGDRKAFEREQLQRFEAEVGKPTMLESMQYNTMKAIKADNIGIDTATLQTIIRDSIQQGIDTTSLNLAPLAEQIGQGINVPDEKWQKILDKYNDLKAAIGEDPIKIDFNTGKISEDGKKAEGTWKQAASAVQSVGSAFSQIEDPATKAIGTVMQAIATIALGFAQAASAKDTTASGWGWLAWLAAGTAAMATTIATVHSLTHFAEGGIVGGNDYTDNTPVMVSSGELILNRSQQGTLADALTSGGNQGGGSYTSTPYVTGEKIVLGINNWARRNGRGELVFSR